MFCPKCGKPVIQGSMFCGGCGHKTPIHSSPSLRQIFFGESATEKQRQVIWGVFGCLVSFAAHFLMAIYTFANGKEYFATGIVVLVISLFPAPAIAVMTLWLKKSFRYSKNINIPIKKSIPVTEPVTSDIKRENANPVESELQKERESNKVEWERIERDLLKAEKLGVPYEQLEAHFQATPTVFQSEDEDDPLLPDAIRVVVEAGVASTSLLQRRLKLSYSRAARIMDYMEERGIVGNDKDSIPRVGISGATRTATPKQRRHKTELAEAFLADITEDIVENFEIIPDDKKFIPSNHFNLFIPGCDDNTMEKLIRKILEKINPNELKVILANVDIVPFTCFKDNPRLYLYANASTNSKMAATISWVASEIERRYQTFADHGVRDIERYNKKIEHINKDFADLDLGLTVISRFLIIVDEINILLNSGDSSVKEKVIHILLKGRAVGVQLLCFSYRDHKNAKIKSISDLLKVVSPDEFSELLDKGNPNTK